MQVSFTILIIGLSNSGKTTIIRSMLNKTSQIFPTAGFEINYVSSGVRSILVYDCSGQGHSRQTWEMLYQNCDAVVFVIDMHDFQRFSVAKQTINRFIDRNKSMKKKCLCIMLNKSDLPCKYSKDVFYKALDIDKMQKLVNKIYIKQTSAYTKDGLEECFDWMGKNITINTPTSN